MGCDIHFFAEVRDRETGQWRFLPAPDAEGWMPGEKATKFGWPYRYGTGKGGYDDTDYGGAPFLRDWFSDRNYRLFGMLANVRNGTGFAGIKTGEAVEPIAMPRGWPDDLSPELEAERELIEHTPSWLTVAEMQDYFACRRGEQLTITGVIPGNVYESLRDTGKKPENWSGGISGLNVVVLDPIIYNLIPKDQIEHVPTPTGFDPVETTVPYAALPQGVCDDRKERIKSDELFAKIRGEEWVPPEKARVYVQASWKQDRDDYTTRFEFMLAEMTLASRAVDPKDVRAVFYFDS